MASVNYHYRSKNNRAPVYVRIFYYEGENRKHQTTPIQFEVLKKFWEEYQAGTDFRSTHKEKIKTDLDIHLGELKRFILKKYDEAKEIEKGWLKSMVETYYNPKPEVVVTEDLLEYFDYYLDLRESELKQKIRTWYKWTKTREKVEKFQLNEGIRFLVKDVNDEFKMNFVDWCKLERYAVATIKKDISFIKAVCTHAGTKGIETSLELPNLKAKIQEEKLPKIYLSIDELNKISNLTDLPERLDNSRDWLIISCFTGQRVSDFMRFTCAMIRKAKGRKYIDLKQIKTGKDITVPLLPEVEVVLNKRGGEFPRPISDQRYNEYIKEVCRLAGIKQEMKGRISTRVKANGRYVTRGVTGTYEKWELIGSHASRRSFATNFYGKVSTTYLKNITGHSTEVMLLEYIGKTSKDTAAEAYDSLMNAKH